MRKHLYILLVLVAIVSAYMVACKNKPTAMAEFIEEPESPTEDNTITPSDSLTDSTQSVSYEGNYFVSKKYYKTSGNTSVTFTYTVEVKKWQYQNAGTAVVFKGFENVLSCFFDILTGAFV